MLSTVSPVMVGAEAASPQPMTPLSAWTRTSTLSARAISTPAMTTGFFMGKLTAIASMRLIFMVLALDHLVPAQFGNRLIVQVELASKNFLAVLSERRRRAPHGAGGIGELEGNPEHLQGADGGMRDCLDHGARGRVRIIERLSDRIDLAAGNPRRLELGEPGIGAVTRECLVDQTIEESPMLHTRAVARKRRILGPFGITEHFGHAPELTLIANSDRDHRVGGPVGRIRHDARMPIAEPAGVAAGR